MLKSIRFERYGGDFTCESDCRPTGTIHTYASPCRKLRWRCIRHAIDAVIVLGWTGAVQLG